MLSFTVGCATRDEVAEAMWKSLFMLCQIHKNSKVDTCIKQNLSNHEKFL